MSVYPISVHSSLGVATDWLERLRTHKEFSANYTGFEHVVGLQSLLTALELPAPPMQPLGIAAVIGLWYARQRFTPDDLLGLFMGLTVTFLYVHVAEYAALIPLFTALWLYFREKPSIRPALCLLAPLFLLPRRIARRWMCRCYITGERSSYSRCC